MLGKITVYDIVISCPSDVNKEKIAIREVIDEINRHCVERNKIMFRIKHYLTNVDSQVGVHPQDYINRELIDKCDILVAIFNSKFGSPTKKADSGTEEEIERFVTAGKKCFLYFANQPNKNADPVQWEKLQEFKKKIGSRSLYQVYTSPTNLKQVFKDNFECFLSTLITCKNSQKAIKKQSGRPKVSPLNTDHKQFPVLINDNVWHDAHNISKNFENYINQIQSLSVKSKNIKIDTINFRKAMEKKLLPDTLKQDKNKQIIENFNQKLNNYVDDLKKQYKSSKLEWDKLCENTKILLKKSSYEEYQKAVNQIYHLTISTKSSINETNKILHDYGNLLLKNTKFIENSQKIKDILANYQHNFQLYKNLLNEYFEYQNLICDKNEQ